MNTEDYVITIDATITARNIASGERTKIGIRRHEGIHATSGEGHEQSVRASGELIVHRRVAWYGR
jgi:hypothetical protein